MGIDFEGRESTLNALPKEGFSLIIPLIEVPYRHKPEIVELNDVVFAPSWSVESFPPPLAQKSYIE